MQDGLASRMLRVIASLARTASSIFTRRRRSRITVARVYARGPVLSPLASA